MVSAAGAVGRWFVAVCAAGRNRLICLKGLNCLLFKTVRTIRPLRGRVSAVVWAVGALSAPS